MMRTLLGTLALALSLTACGGDAGGSSEPSSEAEASAAIYSMTEGTVSAPGEVEAEPAQAIDLEEYGEDLRAIYDAAGIEICDEEPGRDISGALYNVCAERTPVDVRIFPDVEAAAEGAAWSAEVNGTRVYQMGRLIVRENESGALDEFLAAF